MDVYQPDTRRNAFAEIRIGKNDSSIFPAQLKQIFQLSELERNKVKIRHIVVNMVDI